MRMMCEGARDRGSEIGDVLDMERGKEASGVGRCVTVQRKVVRGRTGHGGQGDTEEGHLHTRPQRPEHGATVRQKHKGTRDVEGPGSTGTRGRGAAAQRAPLDTSSACLQAVCRWLISYNQRILKQGRKERRQARIQAPLSA